MKNILCTLRWVVIAISMVTVVYAQDIVGMVKKVKPSVVTVTPFNSFGLENGQGSGFFISQNQVVTNFHVIRGASSVKIRFNDSAEFSARHILGQDSTKDIAILEIDIPATRKVSPLSLKTKLPEQGEKIYVVGNPLGLEQSVSDGIVSSVRVIKDKGKRIQFTAAISPGNSGSPLLDPTGQVLGVASMTYSEGQNLNFAVPAEEVRNLPVATPIKFAPSLKNYEGSEIKVADAFKVDTALIGNPPSQLSLQEKNIWRLRTSALRAMWDAEIIDRNMNRIVRAVKRNFEGFNMEKDTLNMNKANIVVSEALGKNTDALNLSPENAQKLEGMNASLVSYGARVLLRGKGMPVGAASGIVHSRFQAWQEFKKGGYYAIVTIADSSEIADLDLAVFQRDSTGEWKAIACDTDPDAHPYVVFNAPETGEYALVWRVARYAEAKKEGMFGALFLREEDE